MPLTNTERKTRPEEFEMFHEWLLAEAPQWYEPHYIPLEEGGKAPDSSALPNGKWKVEQARLSEDDAYRRLKQGKNVGLAALEQDPLVGIDIDDTHAQNRIDLDTPPATLTIRSRTRLGGHKYCFSNDGRIDNVDAPEGEVRTRNQYLVVPGSYVPVDFDHPDEPDEEDIPDDQWGDVGVYTIEKAVPAVNGITVDDLPETHLPNTTGDETSTAEAKDIEFGGDRPEDSPTAIEVMEQHGWIGRYLQVGDDDRSQKDFAVCCIMQRYGVSQDEVYSLLNGSIQTKVNERGKSYWQHTWDNARKEVGDEYNTWSLGNGYPRNAGKEQPLPESADDVTADLVELFTDVLEGRSLDPDWVSEGKSDQKDISGVVGPADDVREAIIRYRRVSNHKKEDKDRVISEVVVRDLSAVGRFISPPGEAMYYFHDPEHRVYRLADDSRFPGLLEERYDIVDNAEGKIVVNHVERFAQRNGERATIHRVGYWNKETTELCVHDHGGGYYAVTADEIMHRDNGENGVFFLPNDEAQSVEYIPSGKREAITANEFPGELPDTDGNRDAYRRLIVNRANLTRGGGLSVADQRVLLDTYLHTLPFMNRIPEKPILALVGPKGSGKTTIMRSIGQFVCGLHWDVRFHADEDDFWAAVSNNAFVAYDQLDTQPKWLNDALAAVATGTSYTRRRLYTTNEEVTYKPRSWLGINSRDPSFDREDVASRLILFHLETLDEKYGGSQFSAPLEDHYDLLWSQYLDRLQNIVRELDSESHSNPSTFRMADWANIAQAAAGPLGYDAEEVTSIIDALTKQQQAFAMEDESSYKALTAFLEERDEDLRVTASELHEGLKRVATDRGIDYNRNGGHALAMWISNNQNELETLLGLEIEHINDRNQYFFPQVEGG